MKKLLSSLLLILSFSAHATDDWTPAQYVLGATYGILLAADWRQSQRISQPPWYHPEHNRLIGDTHSLSRVNNYFGAVSLISAIGLHYLPSDYRTGALIGLSLIELSVVRHNYRLGVSARF